MPDIREQERPARKLLPIIYVLDTSGSMTGDRIAAVNQAMSETMEVLRDVSNNNPTAELKIGVMKFATGAEWITKSGLVFMEDFYWNDLKAGGLTDFGSALSELHKKLSRSEFLNSDVGYKAPVIIFMSDGEPTDDYESALKKIESSNKWYKIATKIAIAVGDDANLQILGNIAGNSEAVIKVDDLETLKKLIRVVSVTASMLGSVSRTNDNLTDDIINAISGEMGDDNGDGVHIPTPSPTPDPDPVIWDDPVIDEDDPWGTNWD